MSGIYDPNMDFAVYDQSVPENRPEVPSVDTSLSSVFATFSSKGKKNKIIEFRTPSSVISEYGDDFWNYTKFGQTNLTAKRLLASKGRAFICSLAADDAKTAYALIGVSVTPASDLPVYERTDTLISADGTSIVKLGTGQFVLDENGNKKPVMLKAAASDSEATVEATVAGAKIAVESRRFGSGLIESEMFDEDGELVGYDPEPIKTTVDGVTSTFYPLFCANYYSVGKGGNTFGFKLLRDPKRDKDAIDGRRYKMTFFTLTSVGGFESIYDGKEFKFSFNPDAMYSEDIHDSEYIGEVYKNIEDKGNYPQYNPIQIKPFADCYKQLLEDLSQYKECDNDFDIDFITGLNKNLTPYTKIVLGENSIDTANSIVYLSGGSDGSLEEGAVIDGHTITAEDVQNKKNELLIKFFNCDVDTDIFDMKLTDIDTLVDENYPAVVKQAILEKFVKWRPDIALRMDVGITTNAYEAYKKYQEYKLYNSSEYPFMVSFNAHSGIVTDDLIGRPFEVTYTYDYIGVLADNFDSPSGAFQMEAGAKRGRVRYFRPYWIAKMDKNNWMSVFDEEGLNYIMYLNKKRELVYGAESSQYEVQRSKLMSDRNALVIGRAMRICSGILQYYKFDELDIEDTMRDAKAAVEKALDDAGLPSTIKCEVSLYQTEDDVRDENAHCRLIFTFPKYIKKFHVEIIARRQTGQTAVAA